MKASELIKQLSAKIAEHGDLPIVGYDDMGGHEECTSLVELDGYFDAVVSQRSSPAGLVVTRKLKFRKFLKVM